MAEAPTGTTQGADFVPPTPELLYERRGAVALLTFNRPAARNAMTFAMYEGLYAAVRDFRPPTAEELRAVSSTFPAVADVGGLTGRGT